MKIKKVIFKNIFTGICAAGALMMVNIIPAQAVVVYSNDFETDTNGFNTTARGSLTSNNAGDISIWLGGDRSFTNKSIYLTLTGLTVGNTYDVMFDLLIGGTWDGSWSFGPDYFRLLSSSSGALVNATFGVGRAPTRKTQTYSDANPLGDGGLFFHGEGVDVFFGGIPSIFYFGHGAGNPLLSFTANSMTETLTFQSSDWQGISDEFFAIDNVVISTKTQSGTTSSVPEPAPLALLGLGLMGLAVMRIFLSRIQ